MNGSVAVWAVPIQEFSSKTHETIPITRGIQQQVDQVIYHLKNRYEQILRGTFDHKRFFGNIPINCWVSSIAHFPGSNHSKLFHDTAIGDQIVQHVNLIWCPLETLDLNLPQSLSHARENYWMADPQFMRIQWIIWSFIILKKRSMYICNLQFIKRLRTL